MSQLAKLYLGNAVDLTFLNAVGKCSYLTLC